MVKPRTPTSFAAAVARLMEAVGYEAVAAELDLGKSQLYRFSDEDEPQLPRVDVAVRMDMMAMRHGLGTPVYDAYGAKLEAAERPPLKTRDPLETITEIVRENAEAVGAFHVAIVNATPAARRAALKEALEARDAYDRLIRELETPAEPRMVGPDRHG